MAIGLMSNVGAPGSNMVPFFWSDFLRENLFPQMYFRSLGTKVVVPQGYGNTIKIPRWKTQVKPTTYVGFTAVSSTAAVGYMTEGTAPTAVNLPPESISGFITGWCGAYGYSDRVVLVSMADYVAGAVKELGRQLAGRIDEYTRTKISGSSTLLANPGAGTANKTPTTAVLKGTNLALLGPRMEARNVPTWEDGTYVAMINPLAKADIYKDISSNGYIPIHSYQNSQMIYRGELGSMYGIRFISSTMIPKFVGAAGTTATLGMSVGMTGSSIWVFAPDSFYAAEQAQGGFEVIHHPPGSAGTSDPANQIGSVAVKAYYGVVPAPSTDYRIVRMPHGLGILS